MKIHFSAVSYTSHSPVFKGIKDITGKSSDELAEQAREGNRFELAASYMPFTKRVQAKAGTASTSSKPTSSQSQPNVAPPTSAVSDRVEAAKRKLGW